MKTTEPVPKRRDVAVLLALVFGFTGAHNFYLGAPGAGTIGLCTLGLGYMIAWVEAWHMMKMTPKEFSDKYNRRTPYAFEFVFISQKSYEAFRKSWWQKAVLATIIGMVVISFFNIMSDDLNIQRRIKECDLTLTETELQRHWKRCLTGNDGEALMHLVEFELSADRYSDARKHLFIAKDQGVVLRPTTEAGRHLLWEWHKVE